MLQGRSCQGLAALTISLSISFPRSFWDTAKTLNDLLLARKNGQDKSQRQVIR
jgi:hypothetical protein